MAAGTAGVNGWRAGCGVAVVVATTWLALVPSDAWPLATLAYAAVPAGLQPYLPALTHLLGFAALVGVFTALGGHPGLAAVGVLGFSALLELLQGIIPWREASWADMQVNLLAVVLGLGVVLGVKRAGRASLRRCLVAGTPGRGVAWLRGHLVPRGGWLAGRAVTGMWRAGVRPAQATLSAAGVRAILAEFARSFGRNDLRAEVRPTRAGATQVTLRVPGGARPGMALLARAIEAEAVARGRTLHIRVVAAEER